MTNRRPLPKPANSSWPTLLILLLGAGVPRPACADYAVRVLPGPQGGVLAMALTDDIIFAPSHGAGFSAEVLAASNLDDPLGSPPPGLAAVTGSDVSTSFATLDFAANQLDIPFRSGAYALRGNKLRRLPRDYEKLEVSLQNPEANALGQKFTINDHVFYRDANNGLQIGYLDVDVEELTRGPAPASLSRLDFEDSALSEPVGLLVLCAGFLGVGVASLPRRHPWIG